MEKENNFSWTGIIFFLVGLGCFYLGSQGYAWGWLVGSFLIFSVLIVNQVSDVTEYFRQIRNDTNGIKALKPYCYVGILQSLLTTLACLIIFGLVLYSFIYQKNMATVLSESITPQSTGYIMIFIGGWGLLTTVHQIWGSVLAKNFSFVGFFYNAKMVMLAFGSLFLLGLGILFLSVK